MTPALKKYLEKSKEERHEFFFGTGKHTLYIEDREERYEEMIRIMAEALDWVIHPKHDEPDDYTRLGCAQHRAYEALEKVNKIAKESLNETE